MGHMRSDDRPEGTNGRHNAMAQAKLYKLLQALVQNVLVVDQAYVYAFSIRQIRFKSLFQMNETKKGWCLPPSLGVSGDPRVPCDVLTRSFSDLGGLIIQLKLDRSRHAIFKCKRDGMCENTRMSRQTTYRMSMLSRSGGSGVVYVDCCSWQL